MPKSQFSFFATRSDLLGVTETVASYFPFSICSTAEQDDAPTVYASLSNIADLSIAAYGDLNRENSYLLIDKDLTPKVRHVEQRQGGIKQVVDQLSHPESVVLKPGGVLGDYKCILAGQVGTVSEDKWSTDLYKILYREFRKRFKKVKSFYVGELAMEKLKSGIRFTSNIKAPREYDLQL